MDLVKGIACLTLFASSAALGQNLSLTIGNSVAGQNFMMKSASCVLRVNGCADLSKAQVTAVAEGMVGGARRSAPLHPVPIQTQAGVYAIPDRSNPDGKWVFVITANCQNETAGAIVPMNGMSFVRESTQLLSHAPSPSEIEAALKAYTPPQPPAR
jgi:hypothetical protein